MVSIFQINTNDLHNILNLVFQAILWFQVTNNK